MSRCHYATTYPPTHSLKQRMPTPLAGGQGFVLTRVMQPGDVEVLKQHVVARLQRDRDTELLHEHHRAKGVVGVVRGRGVRELAQRGVV